MVEPPAATEAKWSIIAELTRPCVLHVACCMLQEREAASDFVTRFNLQQLLTVEGE